MRVTRDVILRHLLDQKDGLTIEELSERVGISRTAVLQHLMGLQGEGLVTVVDERPTGGRPSRVYALSERGYESFPRRYNLLASRTLQTLLATLGEDALEDLMRRVADDLGAELARRIPSGPPSSRLQAVVDLMNELGYEASPAGPGEIVAVNCVYHQLARETRAVCRFDVQLLSHLLGADLDHVQCMADGAGQCLFRRRSW